MQDGFYWREIQALNTWATSAWDLEMGYICITHLEPDAAKYFKRFVDVFKGRFYLKDALQKLSWHYYLQGDQQQAEYYRNQVLSRGSTDTDADLQALKEAQSGQWPNKLLYRQVLNDGGYHAEACGYCMANESLTLILRQEGSNLHIVLEDYDDIGKDEEHCLYKKQYFAGENRKNIMHHVLLYKRLYI